MGQSSVEFKQKEVWENDGIIQIYLALTATFPAEHRPEPWLADLLQDWKAEAGKEISGCVDLYLDKYVTSDDRALLLGHRLEATNAWLGRKEHLERDELNRFGVAGGPFEDKIEASRILAFGKQLRALLQ